MTNQQVFVLQMALTILVYALIARWYLAPAMSRFSFHQKVGYLMLPHALRHIGLTAIVQVVVDPKVPKEWSQPVGYGDLITAGLAIVTLLALRGRWPIAIGLVWLTNIVGFADFANAGIQATRYEAFNYQLGGFWFLPTFFVPSLVVTHVWMFAILIRGGAASGKTAGAAA